MRYFFGVYYKRQIKLSFAVKKSVLADINISADTNNS